MSLGIRPRGKCDLKGKWGKIYHSYTAHSTTRVCIFIRAQRKKKKEHGFTKSAEMASYKKLALGKSLVPVAPFLQKLLGLARIHKTRGW